MSERYLVMKTRQRDRLATHDDPYLTMSIIPKGS